LQIQLYERALDGARLEGRRVIEAGCGGGGGVSYLARAHRPSWIAGTDLLVSNIRHCRTAHSQDNLQFEQADAAALPFESESADAVVSVESSGHYRSVPAFLAEAFRVLVPAGRLHLADLRPTDGMWGAGRDLADLRMAIETAGLRILADSSISAGVLRSIHLQEDGRRAFVQCAIGDPSARDHFREIMLTEGSRNHERLRSGRLDYHLFICERPAKGAN
jgi:SAM-dependent methyltransferase